MECDKSGLWYVKCKFIWSGLCNLVVYQWSVFVVAFVLVLLRCVLWMGLLHTIIEDDGEDWNNKGITARFFFTKKTENAIVEWNANKVILWFFWLILGWPNDSSDLRQEKILLLSPTYLHTGRRNHTLLIPSCGRWLESPAHTLREYDPISNPVTRRLIWIFDPSVIIRLTRLLNAREENQRIVWAWPIGLAPLPSFVRARVTISNAINIE